MRKSIILSLLALASCQGEAGSTKVTAAPTKTVISSAKFQGSTLVITASYFAPNSTVTLGGAPLKPSSSKPTELIATLPEPLAPGNYLLSVSGGTPVTTDSFAVTIGATGPPGPSGPPGVPASFPPGFSILGESPTPPKGFTYSGYSVIGQGSSTGWSLKTPMPSPKTSAAAAVVKGTLYVIGGAKDQTGLATVEAYDIATDTWTPKAAMPTARYGAGVGVIKGKIYVVGGSPNATSFTGAFEVYDPAANKWLAKPPIPTPKKGVVTAVVNDVLYVIGDFASFSSPSAASVLGVEAYDPATDTWTQKAALPTPRSNFSVGVANNIIFAVGGAEDASLTVNEAYEPTTNSWVLKAPMPAPRKGFATGVVNGILYLAGGTGPTELVGAGVAYDPMHDSWSMSLALPIPVDSPGSAVSEEGVFYVIGGAGPNGKALPTVQAFSPSGPRFYVHKAQ